MEAKSLPEPQAREVQVLPAVFHLPSFPYHDDPPTPLLKKSFSNIQWTKYIFLIESPSLKSIDQETSLKKIETGSKFSLGPKKTSTERMGFCLSLLFTSVCNPHWVFWIWSTSKEQYIWTHLERWAVRGQHEGQAPFSDDTSHTPVSCKQVRSSLSCVFLIHLV